ncbi:hypothetical protein P3H80_19475 [Mycolicibacterium septicum]|nr:hypothetical protein [Mycolicibacterium septicum]
MPPSRSSRRCTEVSASGIASVMDPGLLPVAHNAALPRAGVADGCAQVGLDRSRVVELAVLAGAEDVNTAHCATRWR